MKFINWFKQSLEDELGQASFKRIFNWVMTCLIIFFVLYVTLNKLWSSPTLWALTILVATVLLNTGVITAENIIKFKNGGGGNVPDVEDIADKLEAKTTIEPK